MTDTFVHKPSSIWESCPGLVDELFKCVGDNLSARAAAERLSAMAGRLISRSATMGAANRRGMKFRSEVHARPSQPRKPRAPRKQFHFQIGPNREPTAPELPAEIAPPPEYLGLTILEIKDGQCKFSHEAESPYFFCGNPARGDSSWCNHHYWIVNQRLVRR